MTQGMRIKDYITIVKKTIKKSKSSLAGREKKKKFLKNDDHSGKKNQKSSLWKRAKESNIYSDNLYAHSYNQNFILGLKAGNFFNFYFFLSVSPPNGKVNSWGVAKIKIFWKEIN